MSYNVYCECGSGESYRNKHKARDDGWRNLTSVGSTVGADDTRSTGLCPSCAERSSDISVSTETDPLQNLREPGEDSSMPSM